jgi:hypothetical protein
MSMRILIAVVSAALLGAGPVGAQGLPGGQTEKLPENVAKARTQLSEELAKLHANFGQVIWLHEPALTQAFPKDVFFAVRFRQFPVARILPKGMHASNVFVVPDGGKVHRLADDKALGKFFRKHLAPVKADKEAKRAVSAWLSLSQEFYQDGFFVFEILKKEIEVRKADQGLEATGRAMVTRGGNGEIRVTLSFEAEGKLHGEKEAAKIRPGPRPICQATKLLDPDPIVRRMAEQDLLIMGRAARDYLQEQRARANPELRQAIDRLWQRIVEQE